LRERIVASVSDMIGMIKYAGESRLTWRAEWVGSKKLRKANADVYM